MCLFEDPINSTNVHECIFSSLALLPMTQHGTEQRSLTTKLAMIKSEHKREVGCKVACKTVCSLISEPYRS